jgi:hypothetical protein
MENNQNELNQIIAESKKIYEEIKINNNAFELDLLSKKYWELVSRKRIIMEKIDIN